MLATLAWDQAQVSRDTCEALSHSIVTSSKWEGVNTTVLELKVVFKLRIYVILKRKLRDRGEELTLLQRNLRCGLSQEFLTKINAS